MYRTRTPMPDQPSMEMPAPLSTGECAPATGNLFDQINLPRLPARIASARERLDQAERLLGLMQCELRALTPVMPEYPHLLSRLHARERSRFSRRLELDELLRERSRAGCYNRRPTR